MPRFLFVFTVTWLVLWPVFQARAQETPKDASTDGIQVTATDWPWWRGPTRDGVAAANQKPPFKWSETENVLWKTPIPGGGHGSPIVVGDQVFLALADIETQSQAVLCIDRHTGKQLWRTEVHRRKIEKKDIGKSSLASSTLACDGHRVFINFFHDAAIYTTALSRDGKQIWQTKVTDFGKQEFGSSPTVVGPLVIVAADNKVAGVIAGLDRATGKIVWKQERPHEWNYASPILLRAAGRDQLLMNGATLVSSFDPLTGKKLWECTSTATETIASVVSDGERIFTSAGSPKSYVAAMRADGSGKIVWENKSKVYVPSMLIQGGHLYAVLDIGVAMCWNCATGKELWKERLEGEFSASPVLVGEHIFATNEVGRTFIFKASPAAFELVAANQLAGEVMASPAICGDRIYVRAFTKEQAKRQETLYCLGTRKDEAKPPRFIMEWGSRGSKPGEFHFPIGIAVAPHDTIFVTDIYNNRVQKFDSDGKLLTAFPVAPHPAGVAVSKSGEVYVSHHGYVNRNAKRHPDKVSVYDAAGKFLRDWGKTGSADGEFDMPGGIAIAKDGRVYVADSTNRRVQVFDSVGKFLFKWGAYGIKVGEFGGSQPATSRFGGPIFVSLDSTGNVYTTEASPNRVQKFTPDGKFLLSWGDGEDKPGSFGGNTGADKKANIPGPIGIRVDSQDRIWVSAVSGRVQQFSSDGKYLRGLEHKRGKGPGELLVPHGLAVDSRGYLYVVDAYNHRIQKFDVSP